MMGRGRKWLLFKLPPPPLKPIQTGHLDCDVARQYQRKTFITSIALPFMNQVAICGHDKY